MSATLLAVKDEIHLSEYKRQFSGVMHPDSQGARCLRRSNGDLPSDRNSNQPATWTIHHTNSHETGLLLYSAWGVGVDGEGMFIRLDRSKIEWVAHNCYPVSTDIELFESGFRSAVRNCLNRSQLLAIGEWKSVRVRSRLASNSDESIAAFTEAAFHATNPLVAAWLLQYLSGVRIRMASAILTVHDPKTYTVYDVRAMSTLQSLDYRELGMARPEWLEERGVLDSTRRYADYLQLCRLIAAKHGVTLRTLDRCLWAMNGQDIMPC